MNEEKITTSDNKKLSPEEIKRVKGLGCLQDKRYDDIFNIRVITGNGHITTDEHRAIADAADKFGNGQITMTTRLSMEIQGVPYDNIEKMILTNVKQDFCFREAFNFIIFNLTIYFAI